MPTIQMSDCDRAPKIRAYGHAASDRDHSRRIFLCAAIALHFPRRRVVWNKSPIALAGPMMRSGDGPNRLESPDSGRLAFVALRSQVQMQRHRGVPDSFPAWRA